MTRFTNVAFIAVVAAVLTIALVGSPMGRRAVPGWNVYVAEVVHKLQSQATARQAQRQRAGW